VDQVHWQVRLLVPVGAAARERAAQPWYQANQDMPERHLVGALIASAAALCSLRKQVE
jgi:hypothetical protein